MAKFSVRPSITVQGRRFLGLRGFTGKPFHPPLTDVPIGAYVLAAAFDVVSWLWHGETWSTDFFKAATLFPTMQLIWADGGYAGKLVAWLNRWCGCVLEIVRKFEEQVGFQILPKRWIVERTFAWLGHARRLSKDYEELVENSEAMIHIAMIQFMLHKLCRPPMPQNR